MRGSLGSRFLVCQRYTHWGRQRLTQGAVFPKKPRVRSIHRVSQCGRIHRPERQQPGEGFSGYTIPVTHTRRCERTPEERFFKRLKRTGVRGKRTNTTSECTTGARREQDVLVHAAGVAKNRGARCFTHPGEAQPGKHTRGVNKQTPVAECLVGTKKRVIPTYTPRLGGGMGGVAPTAGRRQTGTEPGGQRRRRGRGEANGRKIDPVHEPNDPKPN